MSTTRTCTVWCDVEDCHEWTVASGLATTAAQVRREARGEGWRREDGQDHCPRHRKR